MWNIFKRKPNAIKVANRVLAIAQEGGTQLTPLQLIKLVYMSQGWSLALLGRPMFNDQIEAWVYGPMIPTLYRATKQYGSDHIHKPLSGDAHCREISQAADDILRDLVKGYATLSGVALSNLTHRPGGPWALAQAAGQTHISLKQIATHYLRLKAARSVSVA